jgi:phosphatidylglycerol:prolipoprotein diacylglycerol transferase
MFLIGYGFFRFVAEYFREPDAHLLWLQQQTGLSMGQWLCVPMVLMGIGLWWWAQRRAGRPVAA